MIKVQDPNTETKSDLINTKATPKYCLYVPFVTSGFPFIGKMVLTTSQSP